MLFLGTNLAADGGADAGAAVGAGAAAPAGADDAGGEGADGAAACGGCVCAQANSNPDKSTAAVLLFILCSPRQHFLSARLARWIGSL